MNKKLVKKMLAKSRRQSAEIEPPGSGAYESLVFEKFAEFIVQECAEVSFKHWWQYKDCPAHSSIREHFGIE